MALLAAERYELGRRLGQGGMATVFEAEDRQLGRRVAVKLLADNLAADDAFRLRFEREARLAARLAHPNVVQVFDVGEDDGRPWIVMELVEGAALADLIAERKRIDPRAAAGIGAQAAAGLGHAHAAGFVHRDVKPQNLLIRSDGTLKIADFGIARAAEGTRLTEVGSVLGTGPYMAPEQAAGEEVTPATDLYALGVVLFEALTGRTPYGESRPTAAGWVEPDPGLRDLEPAVPEELERIVLRCLQPDPALRPGSAAEVREALEALDGAAAPPAVPPAATARMLQPTEPDRDGADAPTVAVDAATEDVDPPTRQVAPVPAGVSEVRIERRPDPLRRARDGARSARAAATAKRKAAVRRARAWRDAVLRRPRIILGVLTLIGVAAVVVAIDSANQGVSPDRVAARQRAAAAKHPPARIDRPRQLADPAAQAREIARWLRENSR